jgi:hypothetical protein
MSVQSDLEAEFLTRWHQIVPNAPEPQTQYRFCDSRKWRFDFYWDVGGSRVAVETHGAVYTHGAHTRGKGFEDDREKMNCATAMGIRVFEFTAGMLRRNPVGCIDMVMACLNEPAVVMLKRAERAA